MDVDVDIEMDVEMDGWAVVLGSKDGRGLWGMGYLWG